MIDPLIVQVYIEVIKPRIEDRLAVRPEDDLSGMLSISNIDPDVMDELVDFVNKQDHVAICWSSNYKTDLNIMYYRNEEQKEAIQKAFNLIL